VILYDQVLALGFLLGVIFSSTVAIGLWIANGEASGEVLPLDQDDECLKPTKREGGK
tara:strand:+ start:383 stop:553 length:171 start_codon:yes stop_codon:yes gene_type:complete